MEGKICDLRFEGDMVRQNGDLSHEILLDFIDFLHFSSTNLEDHLNYAARKTIFNLEPIHLSVYQKVLNQEVKKIGQWGVDIQLEYLKNPNFARHISKSLLNESTKNHLKVSELFLDSGLHKDLPSFVSMFSAPAFSSGCLIAITKSNPENTDQFVIKSIASLISLKLQLVRPKIQQNPISESTGQDVSTTLDLTKRQELVLSGILKGYTNRVISEDIGYSESLVRKETILIYRHFKVTGRAELMSQVKI